MRASVSAVIALSSTFALADDKPPVTPPPTAGAPATPATPELPPANPVPPAEATPTAPVTPVTPVVPAQPAKPAPTFTDTTPSAGSSIGTTIVDDGGSSSVSASSEAPEKSASKIALEISGAGASVANQYVEYKGWTLEHGPSKGVRLEASLIGIQLAYELSSLANEQMCSYDCITGDFGSTTIHSVELGYRFRFAKLGPVRPFVAASIGGVVANSGDWSMSTAKSVYGGSGRAGLGIEIPLLDRFFISATLAYRIIVTENPLRDADAEMADKILLGTDVPSGDYAEDLHLISGYVGFGVEL